MASEALKSAREALRKLEEYWDKKKEKALEDQRKLVKDLEEKEDPQKGFPYWL